MLIAEGGDHKSEIRRSLLLATLFGVLQEADGPISSSDAVNLTTERVGLTPHEASANASGVPRAETLIRWGSSWATTVGWMTKKGGWAITEAGGTAALDQIDDKSTVYNVLNKRYRQEIAKRKPDPKQVNPKWATVIEVLALIPEGSWTTYGDLGDLVELPSANRRAIHREERSAKRASGVLPSKRLGARSRTSPGATRLIRMTPKRC